MIQLRFTSHLEKFFPGLDELRLEARDVAALIRLADERFPGLAAYVVNEHGALRPHVNVFIGDERIHDRQGLTDALQDGDVVTILQALSGGMMRK
ncbi:MAG: MoaD/ThiS family protein [Anaerolineaceae bacterium]|nr:MoaD/ThiS family protein [Anaerolineaceae bacterium]